MTVVNGINIIAITNVFIGGGAEECPGQREEADEITTGEKGDSKKNASDTELGKHSKVVTFRGEIFEGEDANKVGGKADDEKIVSRDTGREAKGISKHEHFQSDGGIIGGAGEEGVNHVAALKFAAEDVAKSGEFCIRGFFGKDEVEAIDDNAGDNKKNNSNKKTGVVVNEDAADLLPDKDAADHDTDVTEKIFDKFAAGVDGVAFDDCREERVNTNDDNRARGNVEDSENVDEPTPTGTVDEGEEEQVEAAKAEH